MWLTSLFQKNDEPDLPAHRRWPVRSHHHDTGPTDFTLKIFGLLDESLELSWPEVRQLQTHGVLANLAVRGRSRIRHFEGVDLVRLLDSAGLDRQADCAVIHSDGGYRLNMSIDTLRQAPAILAHTADGQSLTRSEGGPLRLVLPNLHPWRCAKWIRAVEIVASDVC